MEYWIFQLFEKLSRIFFGKKKKEIGDTKVMCRSKDKILTYRDVKFLKFQIWVGIVPESWLWPRSLLLFFDENLINLALKKIINQ